MHALAEAFTALLASVHRTWPLILVFCPQASASGPSSGSSVTHYHSWVVEGDKYEVGRGPQVTYHRPLVRDWILGSTVARGEVQVRWVWEL
jgi:hypothetical protein